MPTENGAVGLPKGFDHFLRSNRCGQRAWSFLSHGSMIAIAVLSGVAAWIGKDDVLPSWLASSVSMKPGQIAATLSAVVTIISVVKTGLGFERKWTTARMTRSALDQLAVEVEYNLLTADKVAQKYNEIMARHDSAVTGAPSTDHRSTPPSGARPAARPANGP